MLRLSMLRSVRTVQLYLRPFYVTIFHPGYFLAVVAMLAAVLYCNYWLPGFNTAAPQSWWAGFLSSYCLYLLVFSGAFLLQELFFQNTGYLRNKWLCLIIVLAPAFFAARVNCTFHQQWVKSSWSGPEQHYWMAVLAMASRVVLILPVLLTWWIKDKGQQPLYGLKKIHQVRPYLLLLLLMLPLLFLASSNDVFLRQYPRGLKALSGLQTVQIWHWGLYELLYALDFFSIEFFFRGMLVIGFVKMCGMRSIVPAACFYCCIHLGKPMPEAISSFFGGMLLGIISYQSKSIWGGLIIHAGIAAIMEGLAFYHHP